MKAEEKAISQERLSDEELEYFRGIILKKREEVLRNIERLEEITIKDESHYDSRQLDSNYSLHMADVGTDSQEREKAFLWLARENKFLGHLNSAIDRINRKEYGFCIECGERIPRERLEEVPHTQHCTKCKNKR